MAATKGSPWGILEKLEKSLLEAPSANELVSACEQGRLKEHLIPNGNEVDLPWPLPKKLNGQFQPLFKPLLKEVFNRRERVLWLAFMFYDEIKQDYFYFTVRNSAKLGTKPQKSTFVEIHRAAERERTEYRKRIFDVSDLLFGAKVPRREIHICRRERGITRKVGETGGAVCIQVPKRLHEELKKSSANIETFASLCKAIDSFNGNSQEKMEAILGVYNGDKALEKILSGRDDFAKQHRGYFLWLYALSQKWNDYYVILPLNPRDSQTGGIALASEEALPKEALTLIRAYANRVFGYLATAFARIIAARKSVSSATAAIISRNMSHNLGSHVLARHSMGWEEVPEGLGPEGETQKYWKALKDDQQLDRWLQGRMDFVAQAATEWPRWLDSAQLVGEIIWGMLRQTVLLREIVASEGIGSHEWIKEENGKIETLDGCSGAVRPAQDDTPGRAIRLYCCRVRPRHWKPESPRRMGTKACALNRGSCILCIPPTGEASVELGHDIAVAVPGGMAGWHAFYVILENIIRNAAKHSCRGGAGDNVGQDGAPPLNIYIEILDDRDAKICTTDPLYAPGEKSPAWLVRVYDNVSDLTKKENMGLVTEMNQFLNTPIIDAAGELDRNHWGLAEMKIASAYLQRRSVVCLGPGAGDVTGNNRVPLKRGTQGNTIIRAVCSPLNTLGYEFFLLKPTRLAIACGSYGRS